MKKKFYEEVPFIFKIATLFFVLGLGFTSPRFIVGDPKTKNLTLVEKNNIASNIMKDSISTKNH